MGFGLKSKIKKKLVDKRVQNERKYETFLNQLNANVCTTDEGC